MRTEHTAIWNLGPLTLDDLGKILPHIIGKAKHAGVPGNAILRFEDGIDLTSFGSQMLSRDIVLKMKWTDEDARKEDEVDKESTPVRSAT